MNIVFANINIEKSIVWNRRYFILALLSFVFPTVFLFVMFPNIGVSDCDAESYITGAISIRNGDGYVSRIGQPLNHWPPGYSFVLSFFPNPLLGSKIINYLSAGFCSLFIFIISIHFRWPLVFSLFFSHLLVFGFFIDLALSAKSDIFCYFLFLFSSILFLNKMLYPKIICLFLLSLLVPFKLIALSFCPGFVLGYFLYCSRKVSFDFFVIATSGFSFWIIGLCFVLCFNYYSIGVLMGSHKGPGVFANLMIEIPRFFLDFFRDGLVHWYGSIRPFPNYIFFFFTWFFCLNAFRTLKFNFNFNIGSLCGFGVFVFSWIMELVGSFYAGPRLMGYGMILMVFGFVPSKSWTWICAFISVFITLIANMLSGPRCGINHPVYNQIATDVAAFILPSKVVYTNANNVLDVLAGIPTYFVIDPNKTPLGCYYFLINKNEHDLMAKPVTPINFDFGTDNWLVLQEDPRFSLLLRR